MLLQRFSESFCAFLGVCFVFIEHVASHSAIWHGSFAGLWALDFVDSLVRNTAGARLHLMRFCGAVRRDLGVGC
jgi:hypothetical protein